MKKGEDMALNSGLKGIFMTILWAGILSNSFVAHAGSLFNGDSLEPQTLEVALSKASPGDIVILGENHGLRTHQEFETNVLKVLRKNGRKVSVGMEFFYYTDQSFVNAWKDGTLQEDDFLKQIRWGNPPFDFYKNQALFPMKDEYLWALNAPKALTSTVAKHGLEGLTPELKALMPPNFQEGRASYKERFLAMMPHLPNPEAGHKYFLAQSIWDDTMAWRATEFIKLHPEQVLVIIVGDFHVQYGGGLPDRILSRGLDGELFTFSMVNTQGLSPEEQRDSLQRNPSDGSPRAHFLWFEAEPFEPNESKL